MTNPYATPPPPPRAPDPTQAACIVSRLCKGYQTVDRTAEGRITRTVWSGLVQFSDGHTDVQYWLDGGGDTHFLAACPRIDRAMPERPR